MESQVSFGIVGAGNHFVKNILPAISKCGSVNLAAIYTRSEEKKANLTSSFPGVEIFTDYAEFLASALFGVVYIASPVGKHYLDVRHALESGKHVLCEKKLTSSHDETVTLVELARQKQLILYEALMYQHHPQFKRALEFIVSNSARLKSISARFFIPHLNPDDVRYNSELGGGALNDCGIYPASFLSAIFGCLPNSKKLFQITEPGFSVDTGGSLIADYDGVLCVAEWGFGRSYSNQVTVTFDKFELVLPRAFSKPPTYDCNMVERNSFGVEQVISVGMHDHFEMMLKDFIFMLRSGNTINQMVTLNSSTILEVK